MPATRPRAVGHRAPRRAFLVAHGAGNDLGRLRSAEASRVALIEADVRLFRGRAEIRHLKSLGPLPLFWDRWTVAAPWRRRLSLPELLAGSGGTELMLDLKGPRPRLSQLVLDALRPYLGIRPVTVCARRWSLLEVFEGVPVRRIHSVGSTRQLRDLLRRHERRLDGVSIHERLLDAAVAAELRRVAAVVMTWPVNDLRRGAELLELGVDGLITDRPDALAGLAPQSAG